MKPPSIIPWETVACPISQIAHDADLIGNLLTQVTGIMAEADLNAPQQSIPKKTLDSNQLFISPISLGHSLRPILVAEIDRIDLGRDLVGKMFIMPWRQNELVKGCIIAELFGSVAVATIENESVTVTTRDSDIPIIVSFFTSHTLSNNPKIKDKFLCDMKINGTQYKLSYDSRLHPTKICVKVKGGSPECYIDLRLTGSFYDFVRTIKSVFLGKLSHRRLFDEPLSVFGGDKINCMQTIIAFLLLGVSMRAYIWTYESSN